MSILFVPAPLSYPAQIGGRVQLRLLEIVKADTAFFVSHTAQGSSFVTPFPQSSEKH